MNSGTDRRSHRYARGAAVAASTLGAVSVLLLLVTVVYNVVARLAFGQPLAGAIDYVAFWWMAAIVFLGLGYAQMHDEHIRVDLLAELWGHRTHTVSELFSRVVTIGFLLLLVVAGWNEALERMGRGEVAPASAISVWPTRFLVPVGGLVYLVLLLTARLPKPSALWEAAVIEGVSEDLEADDG